MEVMVGATLTVIIAVAAVVVTFVRRRSDVDGATSRLAASEARATEYRSRSEQLQREVEHLRGSLTTAEAARAAMEARVDEVRRSAEDQAQLVDQAKEQLRDAFKLVATQVLDQSRKDLETSGDRLVQDLTTKSAEELDARKSALEKLLEPLHDALKTYKTEAEELERQRQRQLGKIEGQYVELAEAASRLQAETAKLVSALRSPHVRGRWGQMTLRRAAELTGLVEHCDFYEQESAEHSRLRPDMLVKMPGRRTVVLDAKVPLDGYLDAVESTDDAVRIQALSRHARQTRDHIRLLASKDYQQQFDDAPDFVVAFIPSDSILSAAVERDPELVEYALALGVVIATPSTLFALLRVIAHGWRREQLAEHADRVRRLGEQLTERLQVFLGHFERLGGAIRRTVDVYNETVGSFGSRVLPSARRFKELGVTSRELTEPASVDVTPRSALPPVAPEGALEMFPDEQFEDAESSWVVDRNSAQSFTCRCRSCGQYFEAARPNARYCSHECRSKGRTEPAQRDALSSAEDPD